jgi:hypothetical protein
MASEKGLTIKDVDLVFVFAYDLGEKVDAKKLGEAFKNHYSSMVKTFWCPPNEVPEEVDVLFKEIIEQDKVALDPAYLDLGRYVRLKLVELEAEVVVGKKFSIELYLLLHNAGIALVTAWINLKGEFTTDDIITLTCDERLAELKLKLYVKDALGNHQGELVTIKDFIKNKIVDPLRNAVLSKDRSEIEQKDKIMERLRDRYITLYIIVGVGEVECSHDHDRCFTAEDIVNKHVKEVAGILMRLKKWREYKIDAAKGDLGRNLSSYESHAIYLAIGASLFLGSPRLCKEMIIDKVSQSVINKDIAFRRMMLSLVTAMEFLALSHKIFYVYDSFYRKKRKDFQERKRRGKAVNPSEFTELRNELTDALEEYRNVAFFIADPYRSILEYGKEVYRLREWEGVLRSALDELAELARTHYDERFAKSQLVLTVVFGIFGIFAAIEFFEKLVGLTGAAAVAAMTASALLCFYRWYMGNPSFRQFLLAVVIGANVFFGMIMIFEKLIGLEREQAVVVVALMMTALFLTCYGQVIRSAQNYRV